MQRVVDESEYVLTVLRRMRDEVSANAELYEPEAREQIDQAIVRVEEVLRQAKFILRCAEQKVTAA